MATREEILGEFDVNAKLVIQSPGKFESESAWAPYFWEETGNGCCDELNYPNGGTLYVVDIDDADRAMWPEISADIVAAVLEESDIGFVSCELLTREQLDAQETDCDAANEAESDEEEVESD